MLERGLVGIDAKSNGKPRRRYRLIPVEPATGTAEL